MAKQSKEDRLKRLNEGRCPIHGQFMGQIDRWYEDEEGQYTIVGCSKKDCKVEAKARSVDGPWELTDNNKYLLEQNEQGSADIINL